MGALSDIVKQGKALYVGLSNYHPAELKEAAKILKENGTPLLITQPNYNMFDRWVEKEGLLDIAADCGAGIICFSPLAQGMLTNRYLNGIPEDSRAARNHFLQKSSITEEKLGKIRALNTLAEERGQTLAEMALSWNLRENKVTSVLIGASRKEQVLDNVKILEHLDFAKDELDKIEEILAK